MYLYTAQNLFLGIYFINHHRCPYLNGCEEAPLASASATDSVEIRDVMDGAADDVHDVLLGHDDESVAASDHFRLTTPLGETRAAPAPPPPEAAGEGESLRLTLDVEEDNRWTWIQLSKQIHTASSNT